MRLPWQTRYAVHDAIHVLVKRKVPIGDRKAVQLWRVKANTPEAVAVNVLQRHGRNAENAVRDMGHHLKTLRCAYAQGHDDFKEDYSLLRDAFSVLKGLRDWR